MKDRVDVKAYKIDRWNRKTVAHMSTVQQVFFTGQNFCRNMIHCITENFHGLKFSNFI